MPHRNQSRLAALPKPSPPGAHVRISSFAPAINSRWLISFLRIFTCRARRCWCWFAHLPDAKPYYPPITTRSPLDIASTAMETVCSFVSRQPVCPERGSSFLRTSCEDRKSRAQAVVAALAAVVRKYYYRRLWFDSKIGTIPLNFGAHPRALQGL